MDGREMKDFSSKPFGCFYKTFLKTPHYSSHIKKKASKVLLERFLQRFGQWLGVTCLTCLCYTFTLRRSKYGPCWVFSIFWDPSVVMPRTVWVVLQVNSWKMLPWLGPAVSAWEHQMPGTDFLCWIWWPRDLQVFPLNLGWQMNRLEETWPTCVNMRSQGLVLGGFSCCRWNSGLQEDDVLMTWEV